MRNPLIRLERHVEADMDAAIAEMPVEEPVNAELLHERREITQIRAEILRGHSRILEARPPLLPG